MLCLSWKIPVANIWFVISVNDFIIAVLTNLTQHLEEIPSYPHFVCGCILSIVLEIASSSIHSKLSELLYCSFR